MKEIRITDNYFKVVNITKARALVALPTIPNCFYEVGTPDRYGNTEVDFYLEKCGYITRLYTKTVFKGDTVQNMLDNLSGDYVKIMSYADFKERMTKNRRPAYGYIEFLRLAGGEPEELIKELLEKRKQAEKEEEQNAKNRALKSQIEAENDKKAEASVLKCELSHIKFYILNDKGSYTVNEDNILSLFTHYNIKIHVRTKGFIKNKVHAYNFGTGNLTYTRGSKPSGLAFEAFEALKAAILADDTIKATHKNSARAAVVAAGECIVRLSNLLKFNDAKKESLKADIRALMSMINNAIVGNFAAAASVSCSGAGYIAVNFLQWFKTVEKFES